MQLEFQASNTTDKEKQDERSNSNGNKKNSFHFGMMPKNVLILCTNNFPKFNAEVCVAQQKKEREEMFASRMATNCQQFSASFFKSRTMSIAAVARVSIL